MCFAQVALRLYLHVYTTAHRLIAQSQGGKVDVLYVQLGVGGYFKGVDVVARQQREVGITVVRLHREQGYIVGLIGAHCNVAQCRTVVVEAVNVGYKLVVCIAVEDVDALPRQGCTHREFCERQGGQRGIYVKFIGCHLCIV